jgi:hypothetical protein
MTPTPDFLTPTRACAHARDPFSKVGKSGEAVAPPAAPNLSESQKGGCVPGVSP